MAAVTLIASLVTVPVTAAPATSSAPSARGIDCSPGAYAPSWDLAAAARIKVRHGTKGAAPLGMAGARAVAAQLDSAFDPVALCSGEGTAEVEQVLAAVSDAIAAGDMETALAQLSDLVGTLQYAGFARAHGSAATRAPRAAGPNEDCTGLSMRRDYRTPQGVTDSLRTMRYLQEQAQATSDPDFAQQLMDLSERAWTAAQEAAVRDIEAGADNAQSAADWLAAVQLADALDLDANVRDFAMSKAQAAAKTAFRIKMKSPCPSPREANCAGAAVAAYAMMGGDDATVESMTRQWAKSSQDARNPYKKKACRGELYEFRMIWDDQSSGTSGDTGAVRFRILNDELTFVNFPLLNLVSGGVAKCARINMEGELVENDIIATGHFLGGRFSLDAKQSTEWSQLSDDAVKLSVYFGQDALFGSRYPPKPYWPVCGDSTETTNKAMSANARVLELIEGIELPRRESFIRATGPVRIYFSYLCQRDGPWEPCDKAP